MMSSKRISEGGKRRSHRSLTRERVLKKGLDILDRDGPAALNMRQLAGELGVSPMALYNHVSNKESLLQGIAEMILDEVPYRTVGDDWREQIRNCFRQLRNACLAHPGVVRMMESADALPASIFRPMEITLAALQRAGVGTPDLLRAYFLLTNFTMGQVAYEIRGRFQGLDVVAATSQGRLPADHFPGSAAAVQAVSVWDFDASFEFGLSTILAGLTSRCE